MAAQKVKKEYSRSQNVLLNVSFGYIAQIGIILLSFFGRRIFLQFLSVDYLGINGLYSNILTVLSLAELGLDSAVVYSLYKPVAEKNVPLIASLLRYFRKIYIGLALAIFGVGLLLIPFLPYIVTSDLSVIDLSLYYLLFLVNTTTSYFVAHKVALLSACQEQRVQKTVALIVSFLQQIMHIVVLVLWKSYYAYIATTVLGTLVNCLILGGLCARRHTEVFEKRETVVFDKKPIRNRIFSTLLYKLGVVLINNTDNILISVLVSTAAVGLYSNYVMVITAVQGFIAIVTTSLISSVGNLAATGSKQRQHEVFNLLLFFYHFIAMLGGIGFFLLFNDLIVLWLGGAYVFDVKIVAIIAFNFYLTNAVSPVWMYREANGLFRKVRYLMLITAMANIVFSVLLGYYFGLFGILAATALSRIVTTIWYEPPLLFSGVFGISVRNYWRKQAKYFCITCVALLLSYFAVRFIPVGVGFFILKGIIVVAIVAILFLGCNFNAAETKEILGRFRKRRV